MATHDCPICMDIYRAPRMIPCGHSFCSKCLELLIDQCTTNLCPLCKQPFEQTSAAQFPRNFALEDSLALIHRSYNVASEGTKQCVAHPNRAATEYCSECSKLLCEDCAADPQHSSHGKSSPTEALSRETGRVRELLARARRDEAALISVETRAPQTRQTVEQEGENAVRCVNERFDRFITELRSVQDRLIRNVRGTVQSAMRELECDDSRLLKRSRNVVTFLEELLRSQNIPEMALRADRVSFELERIEAASDKRRLDLQKPQLDDELTAYIDLVETHINALRLQSDCRAYFHLSLDKEYGTIMCVGVSRSEGHVVAEVYDGVSNRWIGVASASTKSTEHALAFANKKAMLTGGRDGQKVLNLVEQFDMDSNNWRNGPEMQCNRCGHAMVTLEDCIYAVGGHDGSNCLTTVERLVWDSDSGELEWFFSESLLLPRDQPSCAALRRKLLVAGGFDGNTTHSSCEMFDPETTRWSFVASMNVERSSAAIATWNACAYIFGGSNSDSMHMNTIEQYDLVCDRWTLFETRMIDGRDGHGAATFNDQIFLVGGWGRSGELNSVERFNPVEKVCVRDSNSLNAVRGNVSVTFCHVPVETLLRAIGFNAASNGAKRSLSNTLPT